MKSQRVGAHNVCTIEFMTETRFPARYRSVAGAIWLLAAYGSAAWAADGSQAALQAAKQAAHDQLSECITLNVHGVDDGVSDTSAAAYQLSIVCYADYVKYWWATGELSQLKGAQWTVLTERMNADETKKAVFLPAVLYHREHCRDESNKK